MHDLTVFVAKYFIIIPLLAVAYLFWELDNRNRKNLIKLLILGGFLSLLFAKIGSHFYSDPRPYFKDGVNPYFPASGYNGFPSDHTLLSSFLGFVVLTYRRRLGYALLIVAALIGWARVAASVHHLVDIVGSFIFTALATYVSIWLLKTWHASKPSKKPAQS